MDKENKFKVIDKDGKEIEFEVLFTFESDETKKNYTHIGYHVQYPHILVPTQQYYFYKKPAYKFPLLSQ